MSCSLEELLGINPQDPTQKLAADLVAEDEKMLDQLVQVRKDAGLTQGLVAERMGISQSAVARIESGDRDPHLSTLRRYAHAIRARIAHTVTPMSAPEMTGVDAWNLAEPWSHLSIRRVPGARTEQKI